MNYYMMNIRFEKPGECIKTWKWKLLDGIFKAPEHLDQRLFHCSSCTYQGPLTGYNYGGEIFYVCKGCGQVYEIVSEEGRYRRKIWSKLWEQPYYWRYIRRYENNRGPLAYDFIHRSGVIKRHPVIDAHCKGDPDESAEMIVRYLLYADQENYPWGLRFFFEDPSGLRISAGSEETVISLGKDNGKFPEDEFCVYREDRDHIVFEFNSISSVNIFGFTLDLNEEDWEDEAFYKSLKITFLGESEESLPSGTEIFEYIPVEHSKERWISKDPFGLSGYFLFEMRKDSYNFGGLIT